jgi:hypothetical protein
MEVKWGIIGSKAKSCCNGVQHHSSAVRRNYIFLLELWDVRDLCIRKTADLPLRILVGTLPHFDIIEEFKQYIHSDIKTYIDEHNVSSLVEANTMADDYAWIHTLIYLKKIKELEVSRI